MTLSQPPLGLLASLGGIAAGCYNRHTVVIISDLGAGGMSLALGALVWLGRGGFAFICLFVMLCSCFQAFRFPVMSTVMPMLIPERHLMRVNTLDQTVGSIVNIGSPVIDIALYTTFGLSHTLGLEFVEALPVVTDLALTRIPSVEAEVPLAIMGQIREGWRALSANSGLIPLIVVLTTGIMVFEALTVVYPLMAQQYFGVDRAMMFVAGVITGTCMLVGTVIMMAWGGDRRLALLINAVTVVAGLPFAAVGLLPRSGFWASVVLMGFGCTFLVWFHVPLITLIQRHIGEDKVGRAFGLFQPMLGLAMPAGMVLGGTFAEKMGGPVFFTASDVLFYVISVATYTIPRIHDPDTPVPAALPLDDEDA